MYIGRMPSRRIWATLPAEQVAFLLEYQREHGLASFSAAVMAAIQAAQNQGMNEAYQELGQAQQTGLETYPPDNTDGLPIC